MNNLINNFVCSKCNGISTFIKKNNTQTGLYCSDCGKWIKWLGKEEIRLYERQLELSKIEVEEEEEVLENNLLQFSDEELLDEIRRRMRKGVNK